MHKTVKETLKQNEIATFAVDARASNANWTDSGKDEHIIQQLREKHPKALSLSHIQPRISAHKGYISVFYGGALVKHWGYLVTDLD